MSKALVLEPYDICKLKTIPKRKRVSGHSCRNLYGFVESFIESGHDCCRVGVYKDEREAFIDYTILRRSIERGKYDQVKAVLRRNEIFLVKKDRWVEVTSR